MKVLFLNNYDMVYYWNACQVGEEPKHHLWGVTELAKYGIEVSILPFKRFDLLQKFSQKVPFFGNLDQQLRVLWQSKDYDAIYSGHHFSTILLAVLRSLGLFPKPLVAVVYQSLRKNLWSQLFATYAIQGYDQLFCIDEAIQDDLQHNFYIPSSKLSVIPWGSDLSFYSASAHPVEVHPRLVVSSGFTKRDYLTLISAFQDIEGDLEVYGFVSRDGAQFPKNVQTFDDLPPWRDYLQSYQRASVIAIPVDLHRNKPLSCNGLSTFLDAIAMSKPVVMTRNPYFGIDIEAEGIGLWAESGDPQSWHYAISYLLDHPAIAQEMGQRGRQLCETKYNLDLFAEKLASSLHKFEPSGRSFTQ
jgi:glycosyltransferase involved in cell wall biosynthesis